jgi:hypothetical protein
MYGTFAIEMSKLRLLVLFHYYMSWVHQKINVILYDGPINLISVVLQVLNFYRHKHKEVWKGGACLEGWSLSRFVS